MLEELRWKKFAALSDGFVCLVDVMGDDSSVVQAARVSYGKDERFSRSEDDAAEASSSDRKLLRFMFRHGHTTPFEMAEVKLLVRVPMDTWRQWIRQRTASVNEYSTRYTTAIDAMDTTPPDQWRLQSGTNKQGSSGEFLPAHIDSEFQLDGNCLSQYEKDYHSLAKKIYQERLDCGIAKEQARKDLPLSNYTEAYWKIDLHNLFNFLWKRMDSHAQKEIRDYANIIGNEIVAKLFPECWSAFCDYKLNAMTLSALEIEAIKTQDFDKLIGRENDEFHAKLARLGLYDPSKASNP